MDTALAEGSWQPSKYQKQDEYNYRNELPRWNGNRG